MSEDSFYSTSHISNQCTRVKKMMGEIKQPYLKRIEAAKSKVHQKVEDQDFQSYEFTPSSIPKRSVKAEPCFQIFSSNYPTSKVVNEPQRILTESSCDQYAEKAKDPIFLEWTFGKSNNSRFDKMEEISAHYNNVFEQKIKFANGRNQGGDTYKLEEKAVIDEIYQQIGNANTHTVTFDAAIDFFKRCPLFHRIYNIHPDSLQEVLNETAHHFNNKLTEQEFKNLFLLNNRTSEDYQNFNIERVYRKCILDHQSWRDLKDIFEIFDTFGNETIQLNKFFHKLKTNSQYKHLLNQEVVVFPNIKRSYTLRKVLFEIENKLKKGDKLCQWEEIKSMIQNFIHIQRPTIDVIEKKYISMGNISPNRNNFMLKTQILEFLKEIYEKCPKYCVNFVKVSHYCQQIYQTEDIKNYLMEVVRNNQKTVTVKEVISKLLGHSYEYMDLDEILMWFSIKGFDSDSHEKDQKTRKISIESSSDDEQFNKKRRQAEKSKKNIHNLPKKYLKSESKQFTVAQEFKLSKKRDQSIRDKKVKAMIQEKKEKQNIECSKKFKANPIPASINNQKYEEYKATMSTNKEFILSKINQSKENDQIVLQYLQANTKLFQKPKKIDKRPTENYEFKAEPVPWFVSVGLLGQIEAQKKERSKQIKKQVNYKYIKDWRNLPGFLYNVDSDSDSDMGNYQVYVNGNSEKENHEIKKQGKRKVKEIPNFKVLQQKFQEELDQKKLDFQPTVIQEFNLSSPKAQPIPKQQPQSARTAFQKPKVNHNPSNFYIGSTLKYESLVKHNLQKKILQQVQKQQIKQQEKSRQNQKKMFEKLVRKEMKKEIKKGLKSTGMSSRRNKSTANSRVNNNSQDEMADMYRRVFSRPFLFQQSSASSKVDKSMEKQAKAIRLNDSKNEFSQTKLVEKLYPSQLLNNQNDYFQHEMQSEAISRRSI